MFDVGGDIVGGYRRVDNINPAALREYQALFGAQVTGDDLFDYVYAVLHSPTYRQAYASDLKKLLPRIPKPASRETFEAYATAGKQLADLHIGYETVEPYPLTVTGNEPVGDPFAWYRVDKMRFHGKSPDRDRTTVIYNSRITVSGIPERAHDYLLGSRSPVEWVMERYQVRTDKASGIVNDPNAWSAEVGDPHYILDLLCRVVTVSLNTLKIVESLPSDLSG